MIDHEQQQVNVVMCEQIDEYILGGHLNEANKEGVSALIVVAEPWEVSPAVRKLLNQTTGDYVDTDHSIGVTCTNQRDYNLVSILTMDVQMGMTAIIFPEENIDLPGGGEHYRLFMIQADTPYSNNIIEQAIDMGVGVVTFTGEFENVETESSQGLWCYKCERWTVRSEDCIICGEKHGGLAEHVSYKSMLMLNTIAGTSKFMLEDGLPALDYLHHISALLHAARIGGTDALKVRVARVSAEIQILSLLEKNMDIATFLAKEVDDLIGLIDTEDE